MVRSLNEGKCPECGASLDEHDACALCGVEVQSSSLKALPPLEEGSDSPPRVNLVRELKMPSVGHLVEGPDDQVLQLGDTLKSVEEAIEGGDLPAADEMLDGALGDALTGVAEDGRPWIESVIPFLLWVWCAILLMLFVVNLLL